MTLRRLCRAVVGVGPPWAFARPGAVVQKDPMAERPDIESVSDIYGRAQMAHAKTRISL